MTDPHATPPPDRTAYDILAEKIACIVRDELGVKTDEPPLPVDYAIAHKIMALLDTVAYTFGRAR